MSIRSTARRFARLEPRDLPLLVEAWWALVRADRQLATSGPRRLPLAPPARGSTVAAAASVPSQKEIDRLDRLVRWAGHLVPGRMRCLHHSMALRRLLARRGIAARLEIGVRRDLGDLSAHAWLEIEGRPLGAHGRGAERFVPLGLASSDEPEALP